MVKISEIKKIKKYALANGIRTIDTAQAYGEGERRSLSFNAKIDEEIYQVYGLDS